MTSRVSCRLGVASLFAGSSLLALVAVPAAAQDTKAPEAQTSTTSPTSTLPTRQSPDTQTPDTDAPAQEATGDDVIVTGIRASLAKAQDIKRTSDTVVDAITAEDIGALPDRSVNEALQRVPGVAITRFAAGGDSAHFSVEGSGVAIRGLSYVKGEFNGRDTFTTSGGREISFNDVAPELVSSVEVFKGLSADRIEGGIAGVVSINTRKPFDSKDRLIYLSGEVNYGDLSHKSAPTVTGLFSQQWTLGGGERLGLLVSGTFSRLYSKVDSTLVSSPFARFNGTRTFNTGTPYQSTVTDTFNCGGGLTTCYAPTGGGVRTQDFNRRRYGIAAAGQFATADDSVIATAQFLRSSGKTVWSEHTIEPNVWYPDVNATFPAPGTNYTFDDDAVFVSGQIRRPGGLHEGNRPNGTYGVLNNFQEGGIFTTLSNRGFIVNATTDDYALNFKIEPVERVHITLDGQLVKAKARNTDVIVDTATFSNIGLDVSGKIPEVTFSNNYVPDYGRAPSAEEYFRNPNSIYFRDAFTNLERNDGEEWAARADLGYDFSDTGFLRKVSVGGRYADRDQTVRTNNYNNWGAPSETWTGGGAQTFTTIDPSLYEIYQYGDFFRGDAPMPPGAPYLRGNTAENYAATQELLRKITTAGQGNYVPLEDRTCGLVDTYFCPNEVFRNSERTLAGYIRLDFAADTGGASRLDGNIGVRYVNTVDRSFGAITAPLRNTVLPSQYATVAAYCAAPRDPSAQIPPICRLNAADQAAALAFADGASTPIVARNAFNRWLPALNVRFQLNNDLQFRFAASRAMSRPDFGNLRAFIGVNASTNQANDLIYTANSQNPYLKPVMATQADVTAEWYFSRVGSLTGALFYKRLSDIIDVNGQGVISVTNGGQTRDVVLNGPVNLPGKANIKGAEVSYQQTFGFLPGALSGLGLQATYTYIDAGRIPTSTPLNGSGDGSRPPGEVSNLYELLPLPGLSKHNANIAGFYDKFGFYLRLAYSWRSRYLLATRDCCFPFLPVFSESTGQLDGSTFYTVNNRFKIGIQASNLLNEVSRTTFALYRKDDEIVRARRAAFINDRRYAISVRLTF